VAVNDLQARGLVVRQPHPDNRRCKLASLTGAGRDVIAVLDATDDPAPGVLATLREQDLHALQTILARLIS
jgi:DNA-binding MarR family transcriptional regulator